MTGDTANIWEDIELRIDLDHFCTSCQISSMNKKDRSKSQLKQIGTLQVFFIYILPLTAPKKIEKRHNIL